MKKLIKLYLKAYLIGLLYFVIIFLFSHLKNTNGFQNEIVIWDWVNLFNLIFFYPWAFYFSQVKLKKGKQNQKNKSFVRRSFEKNGESFAQIQYAPAWSTHGSDDFLFSMIGSLFKYFFIYLIAPILGIFGAFTYYQIKQLSSKKKEG
ncbi:hypothetical protein [Pediococcus damnosus]|nr:hypothetical protein [Pediococcus damnosus]KJU75071.1 hypothetical protein AH70_00680 [Pediococcus damnosus LMG 28219]KRN52385.1 hypothetical protein IV84_GL000718 [Pediococcus damnosus]PIO80665.1 hypothetical protein BSQ38_02915 [Pediococcus damnosus]PIO85762.1 hypothetical protein BSQ37_07350 [Pediococcus damnosus]PJE49818.1 hypothetical protein BSQ36_07780 [Pediococcus damnosus]